MGYLVADKAAGGVRAAVLGPKAARPAAQAQSAAPGPERFPRATFAVTEARGASEVRTDLQVICEHELAVEVNGEAIATLMCSRANLTELACGFLFSEGLVDGAVDICAVALEEDASRAVLSTARPVPPRLIPVKTSGFGGCALAAPPTAFPSDAGRSGSSSLPEKGAGAPVFSAEAIGEAVLAMRVGATEYAATRGTHCSALFRGGDMIALFEDIGRHNTFDKLAGWCLLSGESAKGALLTTTGRVSSEMVRKAARLGVDAIASLSGPTDRAVALARLSGIALAGYVSSAGLTRYAF